MGKMKINVHASKKSEAVGINDAEMISALYKKADEDREWFGKFNEMFADELEELGLGGITMVFRPKDPYKVEDGFALDVQWQPYDKDGDFVKNDEFDKKTYGFVSCEWDGDAPVVNDYRPMDEKGIDDFYDTVVASGTGDEGIFLWVLDQYKKSLGQTESKKTVAVGYANEGVGSLVDATEEFQSALEYAHYCFKGKAFLDEMRKIDDKKMSYNDAKEWQVSGIEPVVDRLKGAMSKFVTQLQHSIDAL